MRALVIKYLLEDRPPGRYAFSSPLTEEEYSAFIEKYQEYSAFIEKYRTRVTNMTDEELFEEFKSATSQE
jgi:hypothetical protein